MSSEDYRAKHRKAYLEQQSDRKVTGYMCMIDWDHELGNASDGDRVFPSIEALKRAHPMWAECGIVEVTVSFSKVEAWAEESPLDNLVAIQEEMGLYENDR